MTAHAQDIRTPIFLAGAHTLSAAVDTLWQIDGACDTCISSTPPVVATLSGHHGWRDRLAEQVAAHLGTTAVVVPPSPIRGVIPRRGDWITINLGGRSDRLEQVVLARTLFDSETVYAALDLDRPLRAGERRIVAIGIWSQFSRLLERIGARASDERSGLAAEIALGMVARRYLGAARFPVGVLVAASPDPIAAELIGRAMLRITSAGNDMAVAPWEEPIVQRASELGLGVRTPDRLDLHTIWGGDARQTDQFADLVSRLGALIGVAEIYPAAGTRMTAVLEP